MQLKKFPTNAHSNKEDHPLVTIIIPVFNGEKFIELGFLTQFIEHKSKYYFELIVIDDRSTDETLVKLKEIENAFTRVKIATMNSNGGAYASRNMGIVKALGSILVFTDIDCFPKYNWLNNLIQPILENDFDAVKGMNYANYNPKITAKWESERARMAVGVDTKNFAIRKEIFSEIGQFEPKLRHSGDTEFGYRMELNRKKITFQPNAVVFHYFEPNLIDSLNKIKNKAIYDYYLGKKYQNVKRIRKINTIDKLKQLIIPKRTRSVDLASRKAIYRNGLLFKFTSIIYILVISSIRKYFVFLYKIKQ